MAPPEQAGAPGRCPVLRQVQQIQGRPLGTRRPRQRRLPGQVLLDRHRTAHAGQGTASPDDPALAGYRARRRTKVRPPLDKRTLRLLTRQAGLCPLCGDHLLSSGQPPQSRAQWERWRLHVTRKAIAAGYLACYGMPSPPDGERTSLVHVSCQRRKPEPQLQSETPPQLA
jgi:hypothetical protein